jgi:hypothetical protein
MEIKDFKKPAKTTRSVSLEAGVEEAAQKLCDDKDIMFSHLVNGLLKQFLAEQED